MNIFPAIDLYGGKAVRLYKGDYNQMTVYNENPALVAEDFKNCGSTHIHLVDLEGAKSGIPANADTIKKICAVFNGFVEVGGGIRSLETVKKYIFLNNPKNELDIFPNLSFRNSLVFVFMVKKPSYYLISFCIT